MSADSGNLPGWFLFDPKLLGLLLPAILLLLASIVFAGNKRYVSAAWLMGGVAFFAALFAASIDPYLNLWDEQFHALVARNLAEDPLMPLLYSYLPLPAQDGHWAYTQLWLHKQPLFLWQMALSIKLLGPTVLAVRLPSVILFSLVPVMVADMGSRLVNARTGWIAALFAAVSFFPLELISGRFATDHNDLVFFFYVTASFWAWIRYADSGSMKWALLVGFFSGAAILVKWLVGLLVFSGWGTWLLASRYRFSKVRWGHLLAAFAMAVVVALPWQLYILWAFPVEARYEYAFSARHFTEVIENHGGTWFFHFKAMEDIYGSGDVMIYLLLLVFLLLPLRASRSLMVAPFIWVVVLYLFFTLAATKMIAFCLPVAAIFWISLASFIDIVINQIDKRTTRLTRWVKTAFSMLFWCYIAFLMMNLNEMARYRYQPHVEGDAFFIQRRELVDVLEAMEKDHRVHSETYIFNNYLFGGAMISYRLGCQAYDFVPSRALVDQMVAEGKEVWFINRGPLPDHLATDHRVKIFGMPRK